MNKATLMGNLGRDAELRYAQSGMAVANMSVATNERWTDKESGEKRKRTEWHRIVCFDKLAEMVAKYYKKGKAVFIEGRLQTRKWEDQDGVVRYTTEIVAQQCRLIGPAPASSDRENPPVDSYQTEEETPSGVHYDSTNDEIPF